MCTFECVGLLLNRLSHHLPEALRDGHAEVGCRHLGRPQRTLPANATHCTVYMVTHVLSHFPAHPLPMQCIISFTQLYTYRHILPASLPTQRIVSFTRLHTNCHIIPISPANAMHDQFYNHTHIVTFFDRLVYEFHYT